MTPPTVSALAVPLRVTVVAASAIVDSARSQIQRVAAAEGKVAVPGLSIIRCQSDSGAARIVDGRPCVQGQRPRAERRRGVNVQLAVHGRLRR